MYRVSFNWCYFTPELHPCEVVVLPQSLTIIHKGRNGRGGEMAMPSPRKGTPTHEEVQFETSVSAGWCFMGEDLCPF